MSDIFGGDGPEGLEGRKAQNVTVGDELYGVSVIELEARIALLHAEISRTEDALTKKRVELSEAETLFAPKP
ncbi:MAG: DUF1192 domain-containing protein [Robiginitomaculum sp.]